MYTPQKSTEKKYYKENFKLINNNIINTLNILVQI
jgi:hypothetical protein